MKKIIVVILSLMLIVLSSSAAFCTEHYEIDIITNEVVSGNGSESVKTKRLSTNCTYDMEDECFVYPLGESGSVYLTSSVYDGECVSETVYIDGSHGDGFYITKDGEILDSSESYALKDAGYYIVTSSSSGNRLFTFQIMGRSISNLEKYEVPSIFIIVNAYFNGNKISTGNLNYVKLDQEGLYTISYKSNSLDLSRSVSFVVDKTAPVLEISGPVDGVARCPVTISGMENDATLKVLLDGESVAVKETYSNYGAYHLIYTDAAGNTTTYDFEIRMYLDVNAGVVIGIIAALIVAIAAYMIYLRKHMRTC